MCGILDVIIAWLCWFSAYKAEHPVLEEDQLTANPTNPIFSTQFSESGSFWIPKLCNSAENLFKYICVAQDNLDVTKPNHKQKKKVCSEVV